MYRVFSIDYAPLEWQVHYKRGQLQKVNLESVFTIIDKRNNFKLGQVRFSNPPQVKVLDDFKIGIAVRLLMLVYCKYANVKIDYVRKQNDPWLTRRCEPIFVLVQDICVIALEYSVQLDWIWIF